MISFSFGNKSTCTYCGEPAQEIDHIIPIAFFAPTKDAKFRIFGPKTNTCTLCNHTLGSKFFDSFQERCIFVSNILNEKANPVHWTNKQIDTLDYTLKSYIKHKRDQNLWYRYRADWYSSLDFYQNIENILWIEHLDKTHPKFNEQMFDYFSSVYHETYYQLYKARRNK